MKSIIAIFLLSILIFLPGCLSSTSQDATEDDSAIKATKSAFITIKETALRRSITEDVDSDYEFAPLTIKRTSNVLITLQNTGDVPAEKIKAFSLVSPLSYLGGSYPGRGGTCGKTISSQESCTITLSFTPEKIDENTSLFQLAYYNGKKIRNFEKVFKGRGVAEPSSPILGTNASGSGRFLFSWTSGGVGKGYVVVRRIGSDVNLNLEEGKLYSTGQDLGDGFRVVSVGDALSFSDTGLSPAAIYHYGIYSYNSLFAYSTPTTLIGSPTASAPLSLSATGGTRQVTLSWASGGSESGFLLVRKSNSAVSFTPTDGVTYVAGQDVGNGNTIVSQGNSLSQVDTNLSDNTSYHYALYSYNALNVYQSTSQVTSASTLASVPASISGSVGTSQQVDLSWVSGGAQSGFLVIRRQGSSVTFNPSNGTSYTAGQSVGGGQTVVYSGSNLSTSDTGLTNYLTYYYSVYAYNGSLIYTSKVSTSATPVDIAIQGPVCINGNVSALAPAPPLVYVGGSFNTAGRCSGGGVPFDLSTGEMKVAYEDMLQVAGAVYTVVPDGSGGWYIGGDFSAVGGVTRNNIAHLLDNKTLDLSWNPNASQSVNTILLYNGIVYVGGGFQTIGGQSRMYLAALDSSGNATSWNPNPDISVTTLAESGGIIYVGGWFRNIGGVARRHAAAFDTAGNLQPWNPDPDSAVRVIYFSGGLTYLGGWFNKINGTTRNSAASLDSSGALTSWNPNVGSSVGSFVEYNGIIYMGGSFSYVGGQLRFNLAAVDKNTGALTSWNPNRSGSVQSMILIGTTFYVAGLNVTTGGITRYHVATIDLSGNVTNTNIETNNRAQALAVYGTTLFVGGVFTSTGTQTARSRLLALDASGNATSWNPNLSNGAVYALTISNGTIYVGGGFTSVAGQPRNNLAALDASGNVSSWDPNVNSSVNKIIVSNNAIYIGGYFTSVGGQSRSKVAQFDPSGNLTSWTANVAHSTASPLVYSIALLGNNLYIGGYFDSVNGVSRSNLAAVDSSGNVTSWNPNPDYGVYTLMASGNTIYASGWFSYIGGTNRQFIAALDTSGNLTTWRPYCGGSAYAMDISANYIYVAGSFSGVGGSSNRGVGALDMSGTATAWNPKPIAHYESNAIAVSGSTIYVGGKFTGIGNRARNIAAFDETTGNILW